MASLGDPYTEFLWPSQVPVPLSYAFSCFSYHAWDIMPHKASYWIRVLGDVTYVVQMRSSGRPSRGPCQQRGTTWKHSSQAWESSLASSKPGDTTHRHSQQACIEPFSKSCVK